MTTASLDQAEQSPKNLECAQFEQCWPVLRKSFGDVHPVAMMIAAGPAVPRKKIEIDVTALKRSQAPAGAHALSSFQAYWIHVDYPPVYPR